MAKELTKEQIERKEKKERDRKQTIKSLKKIANLMILDDAFDKMLSKREKEKRHVSKDKKQEVKQQPKKKK